jgi:hypothetical protein
MVLMYLDLFIPICDADPPQGLFGKEYKQSYSNG